MKTFERLENRNLLSGLTDIVDEPTEIEASLFVQTNNDDNSTTPTEDWHGLGTDALVAFSVAATIIPCWPGSLLLKAILFSALGTFGTACLNAFHTGLLPEQDPYDQNS